MNTAQLAEEVSVHRMTILRMVSSQELKATPVGGRHGHEFSADAPDRGSKDFHSSAQGARGCTKEGDRGEKRAMKTAEVASAARVHPHTVRFNAKKIGGQNLGGSHGWEFPKKAPARLLEILHAKATKTYAQASLKRHFQKRPEKDQPRALG